MSQFQYDLSDLLNFDLGFEFDDIDFSSGKNIHLPQPLGENTRESSEKEIFKKHSLDPNFPDDSPKISPNCPLTAATVTSHQSYSAPRTVAPISSTSEGKRQKAASFPSTLNKKRGTNKSSKKVSVTVIRQPPPPIPRSDVRYTYPRILLNAFNSCDRVKLNEVLCNYTTEEVASIHRYDPYGRNYTRLDGRQTTIQMWVGLFKSTPDFFFDILDTRAFHSPDWNLVIAATYTWVGTRVSDVSLTRAADHERTSQLRLFSSKDHLTQEESLKQEVEEEKAKTLLATASSSGAKNGEGEKMVESLFQSKDQLVLSQGEDFLLESRPCVRREMRFTGRLFLHLNSENKIHKIEFVYSATPPPPTSSVSTQEKSNVTDMTSSSSDVSSTIDVKPASSILQEETRS